MPQPRPEPGPASEELRNLMFVSWSDKVGSGKLEDIDRAARLHGIVNDPYDELAFAGLSRQDKLELCANRLMENGEWQKASRLLLSLEKIDLAKARQARQTVPPRFVLEPEPEPEPDRGPPPALFGRRWTWAQLDDCVRRYPDLGKRPHAEILEIVASFPPAPDT